MRLVVVLRNIWRTVRPWMQAPAADWDIVSSRIRRETIHRVPVCQAQTCPTMFAAQTRSVTSETGSRQQPAPPGNSRRSDAFVAASTRLAPGNSRENRRRTRRWWNSGWEPWCWAADVDRILQLTRTGTQHQQQQQQQQHHCSCRYEATSSWHSRSSSLTIIKSLLLTIHYHCCCCCW